MERDNEIKELIQAFREYREILIPLEQNLREFADTYENVKTDVSKLNNAFEGNVQGKLSAIMTNLQSQAEKAGTLSQRIDKFVSEANRYSAVMEKMVATFDSVEKAVNHINALDASAEQQLKKIEVIAEEKKKTYNISQLQRSLENYNANLQTVSEFINKDVAKVMEANAKKLEEIKGKQEDAAKEAAAGNAQLKALAQEQAETNLFLRKITEKGDLDEEYLYDILDRWAASRKLKTKK